MAFRPMSKGEVAGMYDKVSIVVNDEQAWLRYQGANYHPARPSDGWTIASPKDHESWRKKGQKVVAA